MTYSSRSALRMVWWQPCVPALPFPRPCLVSALRVYTGSPLVSKILVDVQLLCEVTKQKPRSMPSVCVYSAGGISRLMNACEATLNTSSSIWKPFCVSLCVCARTFVAVIVVVVCLLRDRFPWTTKLVQLCWCLPRALSWLVMGRRGGRGDLPVRIHRHSQWSL